MPKRVTAERSHEDRRSRARVPWEIAPDGAATGAAKAADRYAELYDLAPVGCVTLDGGGRIVKINRAGAAMLGWPANWLEGRLLGKWIAADDQAAFATHLQDLADCGGPAGQALRIKDRHGRTREVRLESTAVPAAAMSPEVYITNILDAPRRRHAPPQPRVDVAKLIRAGRVNMMGEIASSIAHELNQPLGTILLNGNTCLRMIRGGGPAWQRGPLNAALTRVCESAAYAGEIIRHFRRLLRAGDGERQPVDLNTLIGETVRLAGPGARDHRADIRLELTPQLPHVLADAMQIQQVLLNLVRNSIDALAESCGHVRHVTIRTRLAGEDQVQFSVSDTGPGLPAEAAASIFDLFFSTKPAGMGVGLSISRSIVEAHAGRLWLDPDSSAGATFHCRLPAAACVPQ
jgi:PAS domain S-box-containing protein